jgi:hypothetical protein
VSSEKPSVKTRKRKSNGSKNNVKPIKKTKPESLDVKDEKVQQHTQFKHTSGKLIKISPEDVLKSSPKLVTNDKENLKNSNVHVSNEIKKAEPKMEAKISISMDSKSISKDQKDEEGNSEIDSELFEMDENGQYKLKDQLIESLESKIPKDKIPTSIDPKSIVIDKQDLIVKSKEHPKSELENKIPKSIDPESIVIDQQDLLTQSDKPSITELESKGPTLVINVVNSETDMETEPETEITNKYGEFEKDENGQYVLKSQLTKNKIETKADKPKSILEEPENEIAPDLFVMDENGQYHLKSELNKYDTEAETRMLKLIKDVPENTEISNQQSSLVSPGTKRKVNFLEFIIHLTG